jgi:gamma-glutamyltranspeptidase/glutathione hydrolase
VTAHGAASVTVAEQRSLVARGRHYAVATPHVLATDAAEAAFRAGGTAVDAAIAAATLLAVVYPHNCALGGDLFALVAAPVQDVVSIQGCGAAASAASAGDFRQRAFMPTTGPDTITVPGVLAGWETLLDHRARLGWAPPLERAADFAEDGVPVSSSLAAALDRRAHQLSEDRGITSVFFRKEEPLRIGELLRQPTLAATLRTLAREGAAAFYDGPVGASFIAGLRSYGSRLNESDLSTHETEIAAPVSARVGDHEILTAAPPSQGFVLLEILSAVALIGRQIDPWGQDAGVVAAISALAGGDRDQYLADPRRREVPIAELLSEAHAEALLAAARRRIKQPRLPRTTKGANRASGDTVAVVTADSDGYAVSLIQSIFHAFGSGVLEPATGILCHNRGSEFSLDPASPNLLEGGKRPAHTLMPVMSRRSGAIDRVLGTRGGSAQPQIHVQLFLALNRGRSVAEAVSAPRWVLGSTEPKAAEQHVQAERGLSGSARRSFADAGWTIAELSFPNERVGHAQALVRGNGSGWAAATDPRADGAAAAA